MLTAMILSESLGVVLDRWRVGGAWIPQGHCIPSWHPCLLCHAIRIDFLQVCDLLMACGLTIQDSLLAQLLQFSDFESCEIRRLSGIVRADVKAASRDLLEACVLHSSGRSWLSLAREQPVNRCTRLISSAIARKGREVFKFRMLDGHGTVYLLTLPTAGKTLGLRIACFLAAVVAALPPRC